MNLLLRRSVLLVVLLGVTSGVAGHSDVADHGHLFVSLGDDSRTEQVEPDDQVTHRFEGTLRVEQDAEGRALVRFALPDEVVLQRFTAPDLDDQTELQVVEDGGTRHAVRTWTTGGPDTGTPVHNITLSAARTVDPRATFVVRWSGLDRLDELPVRVEVPRDHIVASGRDLVRQVHGGSDRAVWSQHDFDSRTLEFSVRPAHQGPNPALSDPPHPLGAWFVLAGIAVVSGGAWAIGKKLEKEDDA